MFLAFVEGFKALKLGAKIGIIVGILALFAGTYGIGYLKGRSNCEVKQAKTVAAQAIDVAEHTMDRSEALQKTSEKHAIVEQVATIKESSVTQEVKTYVAQKKPEPCALDDDFMQLVDRVLELQSVPESRVFEADSSPVGIEELETAKRSTDQLLLAFLATVRGKLEAERMMAWFQDVDRTRYEEEMEFYLGLPVELRGER